MRLTSKTLFWNIFLNSAQSKNSKYKNNDIANNFLTVQDKKSKHKI
jgi:hypothetical protein